MLTIDTLFDGKCKVSGQINYHTAGLESNEYYAFPSFDLLGAHVRCFENVCSTPFDVASLYGSPSMKPFRSVVYRQGYKPDQKGSLASATRNWGSYANMVLSLFKDWDFRKGSIDLEDEHPVYHRNIIGWVKSEPGLESYDRQWPYYGTSIVYHDGLQLNNVENVAASYPDIDFSTAELSAVTIGDQGPFYSTAYLLSVCEGLPERISNGDFHDEYVGYYWGMHWHRHYRNLVVETDGGWVRSISYEVYLRLSDTNASYAFWAIDGWRVNNAFTLSRTPGIGSLVTGQAKFSELFEYKCRVTSQYLGRNEIFTWDPFHFTFPPDWTVEVPHNPGTTTVRTYTGRTQLVAAPRRQKLDELIGWSDRTGYSSPHSKTFMATTARMEAYIPDAMQAMYVPFNRAVDLLLGTLGDNQYETLSEAPSFFDFLNPFEKQGSIAKGLKLRGNTKLGMFLGILDLCTDAVLIWKLGLAPTYSSAKNMAEVARELYIATQNATKPQIVKGTAKFFFTLETGERVGVKLSAKVKVRVNPDSLLVGLLPLNSIGLLPSLSSVWDFVPLSFVVDWWLKIGQSLDIASNSVRLLALDVMYGVYSYKLKRGFTQEELDLYDCTNVTDNSSGYQVYGRYVTTQIPVPGPTRLPVLGECGVPDWLLASSLIYKFI